LIKDEFYQVKIKYYYIGGLKMFYIISIHREDVKLGIVALEVKYDE
jgi:hypothetical protein